LRINIGPSAGPPPDLKMQIYKKVASKVKCDTCFVEGVAMNERTQYQPLNARVEHDGLPLDEHRMF
jgi:hypothetical protein